MKKKKYELWNMSGQFGIEVEDFEDAINKMSDYANWDIKDYFILIKNGKLAYTFIFENGTLDWAKH